MVQYLKKTIFGLQMKTTKLKLNNLIQFSQVLMIYKANITYNFLEKILQNGYCGLLLAHFLHTSILTSDGGTLGTIHIIDTSAKYLVGGSR